MNQTRVVLTAILISGILVRLALLLLFNPGALGGDTDYYLAVASNIRDHGVHGLGSESGFFRVPLYPVFLAALGAIAGLSWLPIVIAQSAISIATAAYVYLSLKSQGDRNAAAWGILVAASPFAALMDLKIIAESVTSNLLLIMLVYCFVHRHALSWKQALAIGLCLGILVLTRETYLFLPLVLFPILWLLFRYPARNLAIGLVAFLITIAPWAARNASLENGGLFLSKGTFGLNLWVGTWERNGDWVIGGFPAYAFDDEADRRRMAPHLAQRDDDHLRQRALERIEADPAGVASAWVSRIPRMWIGTRTELNETRLERGSLPWTVMKAFFWGANTLLLIAALIGLAISFLRKREYLLFFVPIGYLAAIYLPFHSAEPRYSVAATPFMILFAIVAVRHTLRRYIWKAELCAA